MQLDHQRLDRCRTDDLRRHLLQRCVRPAPQRYVRHPVSLLNVNPRITERLNSILSKTTGGQVSGRRSTRVDHGVLLLAPGLTLKPFFGFMSHPDQVDSPHAERQHHPRGLPRCPVRGGHGSLARAANLKPIRRSLRRHDIPTPAQQRTALIWLRISTDVKPRREMQSAHYVTHSVRIPVGLSGALRASGITASLPGHRCVSGPRER